MKKLIASTLLTLSLHALASPVEIAKQLYSAPDEVEFVTKFFDIVELHRSTDPLLEGKGPSIQEYSLDKLKFAFMRNETESTVDLILFNWNLEVISDFILHQQLSSVYGSPVYVLKGVDKKSIATQGENNDELANFSYLLGSKQMELMFTQNDPNAKLPAWIDSFPHPDYMKRSHPLREALGVETLTMLSPDKGLLYRNIPTSLHAEMDKSIEEHGGFLYAYMGMMIHEMFHVKDGDDGYLGLVKERDVEPDRKLLKKQLEEDAHLRSLMSAYKNAIFTLAAQKFENPTLLSEIATLIKELKEQYPEAWKFIWNYEFSEGFAEYASAYSMVHAGVVTLDQEIEHQIADPSNNFAYRTGALGGLYLSEKLKTMPFEKEQDHHMSLWENILSLEGISAEGSANDVIQKHKGSSDDEEIPRIIEYLVSTVMDMEE